MARTTEARFGRAILEMLAATPYGNASIRAIKWHIDQTFPLSQEDRQPSLTRRGEELWEQSVRNVVSHRKATPGNIVYEGYAVHTPRHLTITDAGRRRVA